MKKLLLSTALIGAASLAAYAQTDTAPAAPAPTAPAETMPEAAPTPTPMTEESAPADAMTAEGPVVEGYVPATSADVTAESLVGAPVHDLNDDKIGEVADVVVGTDGQIADAVVEVGGFLGFGAKAVSLSIDEINIMREVEGETLRLYVAETKASLESKPAYES